MAVYLDCAATTPIDPRVQEEVIRYLSVEFGNAGSRTHDFGLRARRAVEKARDQVAAVVGAARGDVVFTSGATESNNLAILGLAEHGAADGKIHIVSTRIEHHAVLEPLQALARRGFSVTLVPPTSGGWVDAETIRAVVRDDTLLVSVMHVNNETGVEQPIAEIADMLGDRPVFFHVDAAQGFGKQIPALEHPRIDLISASGHKIYAPKGVGALIARRRSGERPPIEPLMFGGGQERGLRPGTLAVQLIAAFGKAAELALDEWRERAECARRFRDRLLTALAPLRPVIHGDAGRTIPYIVNLSFPGFDAEDVIDAWKPYAAVSDGAACTSQSYTCSHVLAAMGLPAEQRDGAVRLSWSHATETPDLAAMAGELERRRAA
jgi:cysteine desulfurase